MEGIMAIRPAELNVLLQIIELQKRPNGYTIRDLCGKANKAQSTTFATLGRMKKRGLIQENLILSPEGHRAVAVHRFSYKTDIVLVEHNETSALVRMFE